MSDSVTIHRGSILDSTADCIVNPANSHLDHAGGLAAIIDKAAQTYNNGDYRNTAIRGPVEGYVRSPAIQRIWQYKHDHRQAPLIPTGGAYATSAGMLPYRAIIHAVGPVWGGGGFREKELLAMAHGSAIRRARALGCESIAFPAVSCGIFGFPVEQAAPIAVRVARSYDFAVEFWLFEDAHVEAYEGALR
jgi:O-acetyl-ADP-ribose deacetylase